MENNQQALAYIVKCIEETGSDPHVQIKGYVSTGNECYITRNGDARRLIQSVERDCLEQYISDRSA